jgi:transcriptional regulator with XRE-family HTH domain
MHTSPHSPLIANVKGFTERLRLLRTARGLKQNRLAELLGIPPRSYNRWERGTYVPHVEMLVKLADILQVSMDELIGRADSASEPAIRNPELHELVQQVDQLPDFEQQTAVVMLDGLVKKNQMERLASKRRGKHIASRR